VEVSVNLYNDDCFNVLKTLPDESVDLVLTDPPYGTTAIQWDKVLDFNKMWDELDRVVKPKSNIILFASQPFTSLLVTTKLDWFRYELVWNKNKCGSPGLAKKRPQKVHENILLFSKESGGLYNPIMEEGDPYKRFNADGYGSGKNTHGYGFGKNKSTGSSNSGTRYPKSILHGSRNFSAQQTVHPTQKPTNVLNWLIMTYSNQNDVVLDFTMGSGSTGVSSKLTGRSFVGIEKDKDYFEIAKKRIDSINIDTFEPLVTIKDFQLTTQIDKSMKTTPDKKYEELS
jgi:site-specific DNA-methyltransferase (adenine-specific)|tara:strand:- start:479 stop:1333 length:855 start_codon:yes stop_codon:yes gene_type:complete